MKLFSIFLFIKQQLQVKDHYMLMTYASLWRIFMKIGSPFLRDTKTAFECHSFYCKQLRSLIVHGKKRKEKAPK